MGTDAKQSGGHGGEHVCSLMTSASAELECRIDPHAPSVEDSKKVLLGTKDFKDRLKKYCSWFLVLQERISLKLPGIWRTL